MDGVSSEKKEHVKREKVSSAEIVVSGTKEKPYYCIRYFDLIDKEYHVGYGSYCLDFVFDWLQECFEIVKGESNFYRAKDQVVEAFQYAGRLVDEGGKCCVPDWVIEAFHSGVLYYEDPEYEDNELHLITADHTYTVSYGDYLVKTPDGCIYQRSPDIFNMLYERVE